MQTFALHDYESVVAIAEEAHFGRAARRLNVTQPALSARLKRIEEALDARLFERDRGGVTVTPAGAVFVEGAERVLTAAVETATATRNAQAGLGQTIRVGMTDVAAYQIVVPALAAFRRTHDRARIRLVNDTTAGLERRLEQNMIDVAFLHPPLHAPGLFEKHLTSVPLALFDADPDPEGRRPLVGYPRAEAPVLMGELMRRSSSDAPDYPPGEADTMLGAIVLSRAGFGPFIVPVDYPSPFPQIEACRSSTDTQLTLETAVARRALDRRSIILELVDAAVSVAN